MQLIKTLSSEVEIFGVDHAAGKLILCKCLHRSFLVYAGVSIIIEVASRFG